MAEYFEPLNNTASFAGIDNDAANQSWDFSLPTDLNMPSVHPTPGWEGMMASAQIDPAVHQSGSGTMGLDPLGTQTLHMQAGGLPESLHRCASCHQAFASRRYLEAHAREAGHSAFRCQCGGWFARHDSLQRHIASKHSGSFGNPRPSFPCPVCHAYDGDKAFTRRDHLTQHLRTFHKFDAKGIAYFRVRGGPTPAHASLPLNSAPVPPETITLEIDGGYGQTGADFTRGVDNDNLFNFASFPNNFPGF